MPALSVLMLTYDRPEWLREAIQSVLASDADLELIVVNSGQDPEEWNGRLISLLREAA